MRQTNADTNFVNVVDHGGTNEDDQEDCSCSLSIANLPRCVFEEQDAKEDFEKLCSSFGQDVEFMYLRSFSRVRVTFSTKEEATAAKAQLHNCNFRGTELGAFFVQRPFSLSKEGTSNLKPPPLTKQFLISPPASPPVGWQPTPEGQPIVNYDLLSALATLEPGKPHELHPACSVQETPGIIVHLCDEDQDMASKDDNKFSPMKALPRNMVQTRMPERK